MTTTWSVSSKKTALVITMRHGTACQILLLCLIVAVSRLHYVASTQPQPAAGIAETPHAEARHDTRRLLSCMILKEPTYTSSSSSTNGLPFCSTQYANTGAANGWVAVAAATEHEVLRASAADLVYAWHSDPINPRTVGNLKCTGEITQHNMDCWGGNGVYKMSAFTSISCCSNQQMCYIKTGGCVM